ncbi:zinc finger protein weckle-like isoform X2 [Drosophila sulfurigaster albostrigata]|uniref:zinc finger protein weckle-like isoform X2 n=2 Tax=Drosophila sulfurigaster albostrigata TaxID=89887 RepID=UPI002D21BC8F|nr:zinc finger protein weckle-like isoform X2 [Drosophila sulfurigaster albostrigata]
MRCNQHAAVVSILFINILIRSTTMSEHNEQVSIDSHWLNWCRLCAKDDIGGNVRVYTSGKENTWNSVLIMAIRKYFDVHMQMEDELSGVLCKECYTLISELIDFAEHVNKVQVIFEVLRSSEPHKQLDVDALRQQYGLRDGQWTHIIKPVLEMERNNEAIETPNALPKQEFVEGEGDHLPIEEIIIAGGDDTKDDDVKKQRGRGRPKREHSQLQAATKAESSDSDNEKPIQESLDAELKLLPQAGSCSSTEPYNFLSSSDVDEDVELETSSKRRKLKCNWCSKVYLNPASYQKHLRVGCRKIEQRTKMDKNTYCELCDKTLSSAGALKLHKEGMHENAKPFICDHCGKQLKTITALNEHLLVHTEERPFNCSVCKAAFKNKARLKMHYQTHEEPNYICNVCGKKLQTRRTWNMHKLVHSEDRKFKCDVCGALFKRSKTLKRHLISHTGLRPYVCKYCKKTFACNANCRAHKLKKHPNELQKEDSGDSPARLQVPTLEELRVMSQKHSK